ncbi:MAG: HEAT repeat domain-containing protein [Methanobacteriaceae archaeon]|nr:HEAT repeat domain-containing protein [Methanobacteriaceae archaeon]
MGYGADPYKLMGVNPHAPAMGLKKIRHKSNPRNSPHGSSDKCVKCGKILLSWEFINSKYCEECAEKKGILKTKPSNASINSIKSNSNPPVSHNIAFENEFDEKPGEEPKKSFNNIDSSQINLFSSDLKGNNPAKRMRAIKALCEIKDKKAFSILLKGLKNNDPNVRWKIAREIGHLKDKRAVDALIEVLEDSDFTVRANAAWSLGEIGSIKANKPLIQALKDKNKCVRDNAHWALNKIKKD